MNSMMRSSRGSSALERASAAVNRQSAAQRKANQSSQDNADDGDDELNDFLTSLARQASGGASGGASDALAGLSDISVSSEDNQKKVAAKVKPAAPLTNKFLKSSKAKTVANSSVTPYPSTSLPQKSISSSAAQQLQSPALLRLSEQSKRLLNKQPSSKACSRQTPNILSSVEKRNDIDSDDDSESLPKGKRFLKSSQLKSQPLQSSRGDHSHKGDVPALKGGGGMSSSLRTSTEDDSDLAAYMQALSTDASVISEKIPSPTVKPQTTKASLTVAQGHTPQSLQTPKDDSSFATETFSTASSNGQHRSNLLAHSRTISKSDDAPIDTDSDADAAVGTLIMDINALGVSPRKQPPAFIPPKASSKKTTHGPPTSTSVKREPSKVKNPPRNDIFSSMGLMTVDDLLKSNDSIESVGTQAPYELGKPVGTVSSDVSVKTAGGDEVTVDKTESIHTYQDSVLTQSVASEVRSQSSEAPAEEYASDFDDTLRETESIRSETPPSSSKRSSGSYPAPRTAASVSNSSYSSYYTNTHRSRSSSRSRRARSIRSRSSVYSSRSRSTRSRSYSYRSSSQSGSDAECKRPGVDTARTGSRRSRSTSYSDKFEDQSDSQQSSLSRPSISTDRPQQSRPVPRRQQQEVAVQTGLDLEEMILRYYWTDDKVTPQTASSFAQRQATPSSEPARISGLAVSNEALEILTSYNPAALALNDMIKQQLELSRQFLSMQRDMHKNIIDSVERHHIYTTYEDTKAFIESKRKPKLTFDEAVSLVKEEMML